MKKIGLATGLFGMLAPFFWKGCFQNRYPVNPESGEYYGTTRAEVVFLLELAAIAAPFALAGWLFWLGDTTLVWPQKLILIFSTTLGGLRAHIAARVFIESLAP